MFKRTDLIGLRDHKSFFEYDDRNFEYACKYLLETQNKSKHVLVTAKGPKGGDRGIDLKIYSSETLIGYGQCKRWTTRYNGLIDSIRCFAGCMARDKVRRGLFIVTVEANAYEKKEAEECGIHLIDAPELDRMISLLHLTPESAPLKKAISLRRYFSLIGKTVNLIIGIIFLLFVIGLVILSPMLIIFVIGFFAIAAGLSRNDNLISTSNSYYHHYSSPKYRARKKRYNAKYKKSRSNFRMKNHFSSTNRGGWGR